MLTYGSLFTGVGGLDLGLDRAGWECRWQVEIDPYASAVLAKHWPAVRRYGDIRTVNPAELERVDLVCGGFPCQPTSVAGARRGDQDDRWLWPEFARVLGGVRPRWALLENPTGLLSFREFGDVLGDLAALGFDAEWDAVPAVALGAPHERDRIFVVAYAHGWGLQERSELDSSTPQDAANGRPRRRHANGLRDDVADATKHGREPRGSRDAQEGQAGRQPDRGSRQGHVAHPNVKPTIGAPVTWTERDPWATEPHVGRVVDGIPFRVDRLRCLGNAVVPQVAEAVGRAIINAA